MLALTKLWCFQAKYCIQPQLFLQFLVQPRHNFDPIEKANEKQFSSDLKFKGKREIIEVYPKEIRA